MAKPYSPDMLEEDYVDGNTYYLVKGQHPPPSVIERDYKYLRIDRGVDFPVHAGVNDNDIPIKYRRAFRYVRVTTRTRWPITDLLESESFPVPASKRTIAGVYSSKYAIQLTTGADPEEWQYNKNLPIREQRYRLWRLPDNVSPNRGRPKKVKLKQPLVRPHKSVHDGIMEEAETPVEVSTELMDYLKNDVLKGVNKFLYNMEVGDERDDLYKLGTRANMKELEQILGMKFECDWKAGKDRKHGKVKRIE